MSLEQGKADNEQAEAFRKAFAQLCHAHGVTLNITSDDYDELGYIEVLNTDDRRIDRWDFIEDVIEDSRYAS